MNLKKLKSLVIYKMISANLLAILILLLFVYVPIIGYVIKTHYIAFVLPYGIVLMLSLWNYCFIVLAPPIYNKFSKELTEQIITMQIEPWIIAEIAKIDGDEIMGRITNVVEKMPVSDYRSELKILLEPIKGHTSKSIAFIYSTKGLLRLNRLIKKLETQNN